MSSTRPELKFGDRNEENGFVSLFRALPEKDDATIRVFEHPDYYTLHGDDAKYVAQSVYRTTSVLKYIGGAAESGNGLASLSLAPTVFISFLRDALVTKGLKIEIFTCQGRNQWKIAKRASPGNLMAVEDLIGGDVDQSPIVVAVKVTTKSEQRTVGVSFVNGANREVGVSEFLDNDLFSNLESMVIQLGARECLLEKFMSASGSRDKSSAEMVKSTEFDKLAELMLRCDIRVTLVESKDFNARDIEQDLSRLLKNPGRGKEDMDVDDESAVRTLPQLSLKTAMSAASAIIKYLDLLRDPDDYGSYTLTSHDLNQYMRLDSSAVKALNLMPGPRDGSKTMSLFGLLNKCKTALGTRQLAQWLKQPLLSLEEIEHRHLLVEAFVNDPLTRQTFQENLLKDVPNLSRLVRKFQRGSATLEDVVRLYQLTIRLPDFVTALENMEDVSGRYRESIEQTYTLSLRNYVGQLQNLEGLVETTIDLDALNNHEFVIRPEFNDYLKQIRTRLDEVEQEIHAEVEACADDLGMPVEKKLKLEHHHVYGWCMRLTRTDAGCLRNASGYTELSTQKAGVYFLSRNMRALGSEYEELNSEYNRAQSGLVKEIVTITSTYCFVFEQMATVLSHLDVIIAFAHVSSYAPTPYVRPKMHPRHTGNTILKEARHPCMEVQDDINFIPNDVELRRGTSEFLIITGPNMGGKSTYIRQIGVIALMAQVGCFVPCSEAELTIFDSILARVGASDSQLRGVSTFMAEMLETANILKSATRESLIVIDELGRGTSTYDGFGLAWAISEHIVTNIGCFAMFATHFHELTVLADNHASVCNLHVVAHVNDIVGGTEDDITLLYKVEPGISDQSFGIHVAEVVKFPPKVVKMARRRLKELEDYEGDNDEDVEKKMTKKFSKEEVRDGHILLRKILKEWADSVDLDKENSQEILKKLRASIYEGQYRKNFESSPFLQDLINSLS